MERKYVSHGEIEEITNKITKSLDKKGISIFGIIGAPVKEKDSRSHFDIGGMMMANGIRKTEMLQMIDSIDKSRKQWLKVSGISRWDILKHKLFERKYIKKRN